jgi:hypothetical protein
MGPAPTGTTMDSTHKDPLLLGSTRQRKTKKPRGEYSEKAQEKQDNKHTNQKVYQATKDK